MTLRPRGPSVTLTALARLLTPRRIPCRDASPYTICFAIGYFRLVRRLDDEPTLRAHRVTANVVVDVRGSTAYASEHPDDPEQESHAQRDWYADSENHEGHAEDRCPSALAGR